MNLVIRTNNSGTKIIYSTKLLKYSGNVDEKKNRAKKIRVKDNTAGYSDFTREAEFFTAITKRWFFETAKNPEKQKKIKTPAIQTK